MGEFDIQTQPIPTMYFFGVTTGKSSSRRMFPQWMDILGIEAQLIGLDLPINGPPEVYREAVYQIKHDPLSRGALITTHKINTLNASRDLFDTLTPEAQLTEEVSCIYKRDGKLIGYAVDPVSSGQAMQRFIRPGYWAQTGADILCLGAGGSAVAITAYLTRSAAPADRPRRLILVNRSQPRLDNLHRLIAEKMDGSGITFDFIENADPLENDRLMANLPPGSMVINATGMGKDTPGSPITDAGVFPQDGIAWELNYRGELDFLRQAQAQAAACNLTVEDGWTYFLIGWADIVGRVFDAPITPEIYTQFVAAAEAIRG
jgi:shikimate 5-dehydrogenase